MRRRLSRLTLPLILAAPLLVGCAGPRVVSQMSERGNTMKFGYSQSKFLETDYGIVECNKTADGSLSDCQTMNVNFKE